ncbi:MAG: STAS domain-containing protein [Proteobacteria bacterium]|nr:MAG: STAS domain-containing protein [Pseudomonadota bacterium]
MKSKIEKTEDSVLISVDGKIDYESQEPFKESLRTVSRDSARSANTDSVPTKVIFNLEKLEFVGSSHISQFLQTIRDFGSRTPESRPTIKNASPEFKKMMKAFGDHERFDFQDPVIETGRRRKPMDH